MTKAPAKIKEVIEHFDILGRKLEVNDIVLCAREKGTLEFALIKKLTPKMIRLHGGDLLSTSGMMKATELVNQMTEEDVLSIIATARYHSLGTYVIGGITNPSQTLCIAAAKKNKQVLDVIQDPIMKTLVSLVV